MLKLIPEVKTLQIGEGTLTKKAVCFNGTLADCRLTKALKALPTANDGAVLTVEVGNEGEGYELWIEENAIRIKAQGPAGAFYAIQTLRQIFCHDTVPCLYIKDCPDFAYRGFYHDVTRGKVPNLTSMKWLIDQMAYFKMNSLQLYVEHVFEFEETKDLIQKTGYLTKEDLRELDAYCKENFIEFVPSLSTFGHLFELLNQEKYAHLRVLKDYKGHPNRWFDRMAHHTIDPLQPESIEVIKSLIDQYAPNFETNLFNICCDETFDLTQAYKDTEHDPAKLYVDFVKQIIAHLKSKGKQVMMWADILLKHPETIAEIPEDTYFLNWHYSSNPPEQDIIRFAEMGRKQIVCPGTSIWNRFCEQTAEAEKNISLMAEYGYKHGAIGVLNTNWGDFGHTCSLELSMYGMVLGAAKSWTVATQTGDAFDALMDFQCYHHEGAMATLREVSELNDGIYYSGLCVNYFRLAKLVDEPLSTTLVKSIGEIQERYIALRDRLSDEVWEKDEFRKEMLLAAEAVCVSAELAHVHWPDAEPIERVTDTASWLAKYRASWMARNKESELPRIEAFFDACEKL